MSAVATTPAPRLFEGGEISLEEAIAELWKELRTEGRAACPVCGGELERDRACEDCGSELS